MSNFVRRIGTTIAASGVLVVGLLAGGGAAQASQAAEATHGSVNVVPGCEKGHPITVHTPSPNAVTGPELAADLGGPANSALYAEAARVHAKWLPTITCKAHPERNHHQQSEAPSAGTSSANWSGYMTPGNQAANYVQQFWTVPAVTWVQQGNSNSESLAVWGGIGGWHTVPGLLIQDGTESDVVCNGATGVNCSSISTYYSFWIEYYPGESEQVITNLVPSPGDSVATDVSWAGSTAHFELCDYTKNSCVSGSQTIPSTPGKMAEWIVERPQYDLPTGTTWLALPKFNPITISSAEYEIGSSWYTPQTGGADWVDMYSVGGADQLDNTQALFNDTFTVNWLAAW